MLSCDGGIREVRSAEAFATHYRKPDPIKLNQDACTGRKWNTNVRCGWASSQLTTSADQCELDRVQDQMDRLAHGRLLVEQGQQFAQLARAVLEAHHATHLAIVDTEAGRQVHRAVALVLEFAPR